MSKGSSVQEMNGAFWQDIPDSVLEELYKQMDAGVDIDGLQFFDPMDGYEQEGEVYEIEQGGHVPQLPSLFPTTSYTDVSRIKPEGPIMTYPPSQPRPELQQVRELLSHIQQLVDVQREQIDKMRTLQKQICMNANEAELELVQQIQQQQITLNTQIEMELKELRNINRVVLLEPQDLHNSRVMGQKLQNQQTMLELYRRELNHLLRISTNEPLAMLVIEDQPIPQVTFKGKVLEDHYTVKLLTASNVEVQVLSQVKCQLVSDEKSWKATQKTLENDESIMDPTALVASFNSVKVQVSTRMSMVNLKFLVQIQQAQSAPTIQSLPSYPLIVITNESQWCEAAGKLVLLDAFAHEMEVPWTQFVNALHHHFLKATKQEASRPARYIRDHEFALFHRKYFNGQAMVTTQQMGKFWSWFGPVVQTLRFKRHISTLWFNGLIYGLISKNDSVAALQRQKEGSFLIRFSESYPGLFAVGYVSDDPAERVKHYLVKPEDTGSQKTLPDFLREKPQFKHLLELDVNTGQLVSREKDAVLSSLYSKSKHEYGQGNGYVLL